MICEKLIEGSAGRDGDSTFFGDTNVFSEAAARLEAPDGDAGAGTPDGAPAASGCVCSGRASQTRYTVGTPASTTAATSTAIDSCRRTGIFSMTVGSSGRTLDRVDGGVSAGAEPETGVAIETRLPETLNAASADLNSSAVWNRSAGDFASARPMMSSHAEGSSVWTALTGVGESCTCLCAIEMPLSALNGNRDVSSR